MSAGSSECPICGGKLSNDDLRFHRNIIFCDTGAVALGPASETIVKALLRTPGGLTTFQLAELTGMMNGHVSVMVNTINRKFRDIGWSIPNIGCGGRGGALYVIRRKWAPLAA
jgi:hypothetical protein